MDTRIPRPAECVSRQHVTQTVAHPPAPAEIDLELLCRLAVEQGAGFAAVAGPGEFGQVRTEVVRVELRAVLRQELVHSLLGQLVVVAGEKATGDPGLIGDDDSQKPAVFSRLIASAAPEGVGPVRFPQVGDVFDDGTVTIQKNGGTAVGFGPGS